MSPDGWVPPENPSGSEKLVKLVTRLAGGSAGVAASAALSPFAGPAVALATVEGGDWLLGKITARRQERAETALSRAAERIEQRVEAGATLHERTEDELITSLEVTLRVAQDALSDKKALLVGNLLAASLFDEDVLFQDDALSYLDALDALSWRQICTLAYLLDESRKSERDFYTAGLTGGTRKLNPEFVRSVSQLARVYELVGITDAKSGRVSNPTNLWGSGQIDEDDNFSKLALTERGKTLCRLTEIETVVTADEIEGFTERNLW